MSTLSQFVSEAIGRSDDRKDEGTNMEERRCEMAAATTEDCRCKYLLDSTIPPTHDPRYKNLRRRVEIEVEDCRCNSVSIEMEDPRCKSLSSMW